MGGRQLSGHGNQDASRLRLVALWDGLLLAWKPRKTENSSPEFARCGLPVALYADTP